MDKILLIIGILVAIAILITGGFGLFRATLQGVPNGGFSFFSSGPLASGPNGGATEPDTFGVTPGEGAAGGEPKEEGNASMSAKSSMQITSVNRPGNSVESPKNEYIVLRHTGQKGAKAVLIGGWSINNSQGKRYVIGAAERIPLLDTAAGVAIQPGEEVYVHTGASPIGRSFQENICTGYLNRTYSFTPSLQEACPRVDFSSLLQFKDACIQFLERNTGSCRVPRITQEDAIAIGNECVQYISDNLNYSGCVKNYRNASDFYRGRWHFYLDRPEKLWREVHDRITLQDETGAVVSVYQY